MKPRRTDTHLALVERVRGYIDRHTDEPLPLVRLAREAGVSPAHLQRTFTRVVGLSPRQYQEQRRVGALKSALRDGRTVSSATYEAGFATGRRVYEAADDALGMTPGAYRRRGAGVTIHYTVVPASLGLLLVAVTERGVCGVSLGDAEESLVAALARSFPPAELVRATDARDRLVDAVVAHVGRRDRRRGAAARRARHRVPVAGVARAAAHPRGRDAYLPGGRARARPPVGGARGGARLREQPRRGPHPLSSRRARRRRPRRLPLGRRPQGRAAGA